LQALADGSGICFLPLPQHSIRYHQWVRRGGIPPQVHGVLARVVEVTITVTTSDGDTRTSSMRLLTTLLDAHRYPATDLVRLHHQRWEAETAFFALKATLREPSQVLRSHHPVGVNQEIYAYLITYQALRITTGQAADTAGIAPDRRRRGTVAARRRRRRNSTPGLCGPLAWMLSGAAQTTGITGVVMIGIAMPFLISLAYPFSMRTLTRLDSRLATASLQREDWSLGVVRVPSGYIRMIRRTLAQGGQTHIADTEQGGDRFVRVVDITLGGLAFVGARVGLNTPRAAPETLS
jgi:hypothetical protein